MAADQVAVVLEYDLTVDDTLDRCQLMDAPQKKVVARFLKWFAGQADEDWAEYAQKALDERWHRFL